MFTNTTPSREMNISADLWNLQHLESQKSSSLEEFVQTVQDEYYKEWKHLRTLKFSGWRFLPEDSLAQASILNDLPNDFFCCNCNKHSLNQAFTYKYC